MPRLLTGRRKWLKLTALGVAALSLWYFTAYPRGALRAYLDGLAGYDEVRTFGYPPPEQWRYAELLNDRYGVQVSMVAGCVVTDEEFVHTRGYNRVARPRLIRKHGRDIFAECRAEAKAEVRARKAKHPDLD